MDTVYVVQETMRKVNGAWRSVHDFSPALVYGDIQILFQGGQNIPLAAYPLIRELKSKLRNIKHTDYLLLAGDPVLIGMATVIATQITVGQINLLKWDRATGRYLKVPVDFYDYYSPKPRRLQ